MNTGKIGRANPISVSLCEEEAEIAVHWGKTDGSVNSMSAAANMRERPATTKGRKALREEPRPNAADLPPPLRVETAFAYDSHAHDLYGAVAALLTSLGDGFGRWPRDGSSGVRLSIHPASRGASLKIHPLLESYQAVSGCFTNFQLRRRLYEAAGRDVRLLSVYDHFMHEVVLPHLKQRLRAAGDLEACDDGTCTFHYQRPPSVRVQPPDAAVHGPTHSDDEYGHQPGEINFWLPLTDWPSTDTTLWVESAPGSADFHPLPVTHGEVAAFHGTLCRHYAPPNHSACTRISLDFRVGVGRFFDPHWQLKGAKAQHSRAVVCV